MDMSEIGLLAAEVMDDWSEADGRLRTIAIVAEFDDGEGTTICYRCNDDRRWVQRAFFDEAVVAADLSGSRTK